MIHNRNVHKNIDTPQRIDHLGYQRIYARFGTYIALSGQGLSPHAFDLIGYSLQPAILYIQVCDGNVSTSLCKTQREAFTHITTATYHQGPFPLK
jgi:hypothetical protein